MHKECLAALQSSLRGIAPKEGIAYLLSRVDSNYWIPIAASNEILDKIPYYRLGYDFNLDTIANQGPTQIKDEIIELVTRGKIEAVLFHSAFIQEVISVGTQKPATLAIVRSSVKNFSSLSPDASDGLHPLMELIHKIWGKQSFESLTATQSGESTTTPDLIAEKAAKLLSDELRFPPYFLLTDYVLSVHATEASREKHICSNPLGYTCLIRKYLAKNPPPWVGVMAERNKSYREDVRNPDSVTTKQAESYKQALRDIDVLAVKLTDRLRDDVILVASVPEGSPESARVKLWARHNRSMDNPTIADCFSVIECKSAAMALQHLLEHSPYENKLNPSENDFLVVSWATWLDSDGSWKAIHVSCDTSHRFPLPPDQVLAESWITLCRPNGENVHPRIQISFRPVEAESSEKTNAAVGLVLDHFYEQLVGLDPKLVIASFWKSVAGKQQKYCDLFKTGSPLHNQENWSKIDSAALKPLIDLLIPDLKVIGHLGKWAGFKKYNETFKITYIHLANGFKENRIAAQLVEFLLGKPEPTMRTHLEYFDGDGVDVTAFLQALYILHNDQWELDFAEARHEVFGMSGAQAEVFAIGVLKSTIRRDWPSLAQGGFHDFTDEQLKKASGELRCACTMLRKMAKKFGMVGQLEDESKISLYFEFKGKRKR